jgi:SAM-dependent methyltransferase
MKDVTVDLEGPSFYEEPDTKFYRFKRNLTLTPVLRIIRKIVKRNRAFSFLEIGTGAGFLIAALESECPQAKLTGLEYDERLISLTKKKVKAARIMQGNAESFDIKDETFDLIVSLQVIEHLYHPERMLAAVRKHLKPGGAFILTTPNPGGWGARLLKDKWHAYREDHVSLKGIGEWVALAEQSGLAPIYCGSTFFTGIPIFNRLPLGLLNWSLLFLVGSMRWRFGESFVGIFEPCAPC